MFSIIPLQWAVNVPPRRASRDSAVRRRMPIMDILFADDLLLAIDKPAGLPVLPDGWTPDAPFVLRMAEAEYGKLWVVHRLDKSTSGVLVLARNAEAHRALSLQFEKHEAEKVYHALANGHPPWKEKT